MDRIKEVEAAAPAAPAPAASGADADLDAAAALIQGAASATIVGGDAPAEGGYTKPPPAEPATQKKSSACVLL